MAPSAEPDRQLYFIKVLKERMAKYMTDTGRTLTYNVVTFGCQMNARDSEKLSGIWSQSVIPGQTARMRILLSTIPVPSGKNANLKVYGRLGTLKKVKENRPGMLIALCGCMMQEPHVVQKLRDSYRHVDIIFGTHNIYKLAELIYDRLESGSMIIDLWKDTDKIVEDLPKRRKYPFKSGINIMFGCNNFCSYCIVPYVRAGSAAGGLKIS